MDVRQYCKPAGILLVPFWEGHWKSHCLIYPLFVVLTDT